MKKYRKKNILKSEFWKSRKKNSIIIMKKYRKNHSIITIKKHRKKRAKKHSIIITGKYRKRHCVIFGGKTAKVSRKNTGKTPAWILHNTNDKI